MDHILTIWTIRLAVLCLFTVLITRTLYPSGSERVKMPWIRLLNFIWLLGAVLSLIHTVCAFGFFHQWSHFTAVEDTANQTDELLGFRFGGGLFFNYVFVLLWMFDASWLVCNRKSYEERSDWFGIVINGYLLFIAINGTIIFESGISRWGGVVLLMTLVTCILLNRQQLTRNRSTQTLPEK